MMERLRSYSIVSIAVDVSIFMLVRVSRVLPTLAPRDSSRMFLLGPTSHHRRLEETELRGELIGRGKGGSPTTSVQCCLCADREKRMTG